MAMAVALVVAALALVVVAVAVVAFVVAAFLVELWLHIRGGDSIRPAWISFREIKPYHFFIRGVIGGTIFQNCDGTDGRFPYGFRLHDATGSGTRVHTSNSHYPGTRFGFDCRLHPAKTQRGTRLGGVLKASAGPIRII